MITSCRERPERSEGPNEVTLRACYALNRLEKPMIADLKQPAKNWIADHLENFQTLIDAGDDPSCIITYKGVEVEIRLNKLPGVFERETIKVLGVERPGKRPASAGPKGGTIVTTDLDRFVRRRPIYCPCDEETPDPCPECGATVSGNDAVNGVCQAIRRGSQPDDYGLRLVVIDRRTGKEI